MKEQLKDKINGFLKTPFDKRASLKGEPATDEQIDNAQKELGTIFHHEYIDFVKEFGGAYMGVDIYAFQNHSMMSKETVVALNFNYRESYKKRSPYELIAKGLVFSVDGSGNPLLISSDGEVVIIYHDSDETEALASSFNNFIHKVIDGELTEMF